MDLHEALSQATMSRDEAEGRVYGWLPGVVTDIDTKLMQIKCRFGKQGDQESSDWIPPMGMGSIESLPETGDPVGLVFMDGDIHRPAYFYFPQSTTKGRPTQPIPLGTSMVGMFNYFVDQFNQLRADFNSFISTYNGHTHLITYNAGPSTGATTTSATTTASGSSTAAAAANKGKASDGSVVANNTSSAVVLSKRSLVR